LLLADDGLADALELFPIDQAGCVVVIGEAFVLVGLVLEDTMAEVFGHPDVESAAGCALQDVHVEDVFAHANKPRHKVPRLRVIFRSERSHCARDDRVYIGSGREESVMDVTRFPP